MTRALKGLGAQLILAVFAVIALVPLLLVLINSFKDNADVLSNPFALPTSLSFDNFVTAWTYGQFG
ncbi:carbohydrate ABC transporter permease, partial [Listeria monocytogenes]|nr:carbohydrate ABC transporter permease [Listeria monocytogenes]